MYMFIYIYIYIFFPLKDHIFPLSVLEFCGIMVPTYFENNNVPTVVPWTTRLWTDQVYLYVDFFLNKHSIVL